jgi:hypothetical protein
MPLFRSPLRANLTLGAALLGAVATASAGSAGAAPNLLRFEVTEGNNLNSFVRQGPVAAHLVLRSGRDPRLLVAFPAGNGGVGLWFQTTPGPVAWRQIGEAAPVTLADAAGRPLHGISAALEIDAARLPDRGLTPKMALLTSVRVLRDYQYGAAPPTSVQVNPLVEGGRITWSRDRLDGSAGYRLSLTVTHGTLAPGGRLVAGEDGKIGLRLEAASGETPLTPIDAEDLLGPAANGDAKTRDTLTFLSYREKFLAGSWRFNTYFGRDTLMSLRLLMPALRPVAVEGGLRSVVARLSPAEAASPGGEVAHEEGIGEFAILAHVKAGEGTSDAPVYDYAMIDGAYMLAPVAAAWLADDPRGRARAVAFLASPSGRAGDPDETVGGALMRNLRWVLAHTRPFAEEPAATHLLALKPGHPAGQWRDSGIGLGGGRYPFDVNAVFAPAALSAIARLHTAGLLDPYLTPVDRDVFADAGRMAKVWRDKAPGFFDVTVPAETARRQIAAFAQAQGVPATAGLAAVGQEPVRFHALSLDSAGAPVAVVNSDEGFDLLFGQPGPDVLDREVLAMMRPFPAGLMTDVGLLVANPAYATLGQQALFTRGGYHGLVVWSWQQAILAAGLERQLGREDLTPALRADLERARSQLWVAIGATRAVQTSELWSWSFERGRYHVAPYGTGAGDADESNAAQLWSTVFLALKDPTTR